MASGEESTVLVRHKVGAGARLDAQFRRLAQLEIETLGCVTVGSDAVTCHLPITPVLPCSFEKLKNLELNKCS